MKKLLPSFLFVFSFLGISAYSFKVDFLQAFAIDTEKLYSDDGNLDYTAINKICVDSRDDSDNIIVNTATLLNEFDELYQKKSEETELSALTGIYNSIIINIKNILKKVPLYYQEPYVYTDSTLDKWGGTYNQRDGGPCFSETRYKKIEIPENKKVHTALNGLLNKLKVAEFLIEKNINPKNRDGYLAEFLIEENKEGFSDPNTFIKKKMARLKLGLRF